MRSLLIYFFLLTVVALKLKKTPSHDRDQIILRCSVVLGAQDLDVECREDQPSTFLEGEPHAPVNDSLAGGATLQDASNALTVLQADFFHPELGTWPTAIDWTAAVLQTGLSGMTSTLSEALMASGRDSDNAITINVIDKFFSQAIASHFGQNALAIRGQAYDDILWVVLGWLEATEFIRTHSGIHRQVQHGNNTSTESYAGAESWYGNYWTETFAHRARVFWGLAEKGWGTDLCGGGMNWNPRMWVYKNAITNELWISASVQMYLNFPGDNITSPWRDPGRTHLQHPARDPKHLAAAIEGYRWLRDVNMTNHKGLFVDGYHISDQRHKKKCDQRNEMVYTYNQGVLLTGQRGLWTATGSASYLEDGHRLIQAAINASGWDLKHGRPWDNMDALPANSLPPWHGLGRGGLMEDQCDASGTCSQNGHTFKGIYFHHLSLFCSQLPVPLVEPSQTLNRAAFERIADAHDSACGVYSAWLKHNAEAALATRNGKGHFGIWWGAGIFNVTGEITEETDGITHGNPDATDYRNKPTPNEAVWGRLPSPSDQFPTLPRDPGDGPVGNQVRLGRGRLGDVRLSERGDPNDRGLGRTVESHFGGMSVLRAWWEVSSRLRR